jgi:hypothetical protein
MPTWTLIEESAESRESLSTTRDSHASPNTTLVMQSSIKIFIFNPTSFCPILAIGYMLH